MHVPHFRRSTSAIRSSRSSHCTAGDDALLARYEARAGARHPGHLDMHKKPEIEAALAAGRYGPLGLGSTDVVIVDTTSFDELDVDALAAAARDHLA